MSKKVTISEDQIQKLVEQGLLPGGDEHTDGLVKKKDISALAHHYAKSDDNGRSGIIKKATDTHGEVFANKIKIRAKGVLEGLSEDELNESGGNGDYGSKFFLDGKHSKGKKAFYPDGKIVEPEHHEKDMSDHKAKVEDKAKPVNESKTVTKKEVMVEITSKQADDGGIDEFGGGMDEQELSEELPVTEDTLDETTTSASSGQYSSKFFIAAPGHENRTLLYPGGKIVEPNRGTHVQGVNAFTVTKGKLKEGIMDPNWVDKLKQLGGNEDPNTNDFDQKGREFVKKMILNRANIQSPHQLDQKGNLAFTYGDYFINIFPQQELMSFKHPGGAEFTLSTKQIGNELFSQLLACLQTGGDTFTRRK